MPNNDAMTDPIFNLANWWEVPTDQDIPVGYIAYVRSDGSWGVDESTRGLPAASAARVSSTRYFTAQRILPDLPSELGSRIYNVTPDRMNLLYEEGYRYIKNQWVLFRKGGYDVVTDSALRSWTLSPDGE